MWKLVLLMFGGTFIYPAYAQDAGALLSCPSKKDDKERLICFDAAMKADLTKEGSQSKASEEVTASTKDVVSSPTSSAEPVSYKLIDPDDLYVAPGKYEGRPIELRRVRCFHADKNEYRCGAPGSLALTLFTPHIRPDSEKEAIENDCGEVKKMVSSPKCSKTIRFVPAKHGEDIVNGYQKRVLVVAPYFEIVSVAPKAKR